MIELEVVAVTARPKSDEHPHPEASVRLKERAGARVLEFGIGPGEAQAIALALHGRPQPRPMTHDLIGNLLHALDDVAVLRLVITRWEQELPVELARQLAQGEAMQLTGTGIYAELELRHRDRVISLDCRPSDGIAVAIRLGVPIAADGIEPILAAA